MQNNFFEFDDYYYCIDRIIFIKWGYVCNSKEILKNFYMMMNDTSLKLCKKKIRRNLKIKNCVKIIILQIFYRTTFYNTICNNLSLYTFLYYLFFYFLSFTLFTSFNILRIRRR